MEIFFRGEWGTICDNNWSIRDANVTCRHLGYKFAVRALGRDEVPPGSGQIWLDNVGCHGDEQNLTECSHRGLGNHYCSHAQDAGVECSSIGKLKDILVWVNLDDEGRST